MKEKVKQIAKELGIAAVGIAPCERLRQAEKIISHNRSKGFLSGFERFNEENILDPVAVFSPCQSVIVALFPYYNGKGKKTNISRYAKVLDYHVVAREYLTQLAEKLSEEIEGFQYEIYVDNSPLSERALAYQAGLGVWGHNHTLIHPVFGSYFFIGMVLNNAPIEADGPMVGRCSGCEKCQKACPTGAIVSEELFCAKGCISYFTQKKGTLTEAEQEAMQKSGFAWGCDICQEVCPHNKQLPLTSVMEFQQNHVEAVEQQKANEAFKKNYSQCAFTWRGKQTLLRNLHCIQEVKTDD